MHESESEVTQSCPTLSDPMYCSLPGYSAHGIFQARVLEWGAMETVADFIFLGSKNHCGWCLLLGRKVMTNLLLLLLLSRFRHVRLCATPETAAHQAPPSLGFSRQEHWSGLPFTPPMHKSEKSKWSRSVVSDPQRPHGLQPPSIGFSRQEYWSGVPT